MATVAPPNVVGILDEIPLLQPAQLREVRGTLQVQFQDPAELLSELVRRGWLTPFQRDAVFHGRARELVLGPYILIERLGHGGMGEVFKARHQLLKRIVALKVTRSDCLSDDSDERRFIREIQATAQLTHPNIVSAVDANQFDGMFVLAMEFVEGINLAKLVRDKGPLPIPQACAYIRQAALGLQHAFERGLVHRDIKPANLLLTADGSQVKVADLGLVRLGRGADETPLTKSGMMIGTPDYLAPEQATDSRNVDIRADLYSLGCTFYYLLAGRPPFQDGNTVAVIFHHLEVPAPPIQSLRSEVTNELAGVVHKLLAKRPEERFQQPADLIAALESLGKSPPCDVARKETPTPVDAEPPKKPRWRRLVIATLLLICGGSGVGVWQWRARDKGESAKPLFTNSLDMKFAWIAADTQTTAANGEKAGGTQKVAASRKAFYFADRPTTVSQFRAFVQATRYRTEAERDSSGALTWLKSKGDWVTDPACNWKTPGWTLSDDQPVVCVSRYDALAFCYWLSRKEGRAYRLPTEGEWERVSSYENANGRTTDSTQNIKFANGDGSAERKGKDGSPQSTLSNLTEMPPTLWHWCADAFNPAHNTGDPDGGSPGQDRNRWGVMRRGVWVGPVPRADAGSRMGLQVNNRRNDSGFRIVLEAGVR